MKSLWNDAEAAQHKGDLGLRVYTSQLLGREPALVLHGGGNTSVKIRERMLTGEEGDVLAEARAPARDAGGGLGV